MPNVVYDTESKYENLSKDFQSLYKEKFSSQTESELPKCKVFGNILDSLDWLTQNQDGLLANQLKHSKPAMFLEEHQLTTSSSISDNFPQKTNVLITGSLYLVGLSLKVLNFKID